MFEQTFKNIDDVLWKGAGCTTELDYTEQTSWILFLKYLDDLEDERKVQAELHGKPYSYLLDDPHRWSSWAAPKTKDGALDHRRTRTGPDLIAFVDADLFPYLQSFKARAPRPDTIEYKIGEIFGEINLADQLCFGTSEQKHELSHLYEAKIKNMGNAGRNGGEYYTPRPLIRAMVKVIQPMIGERIYDGACGSAGFLCESYEFLRTQPNLSTGDLERL
jgi:type I restriction enzyme M protein